MYSYIWLFNMSIYKYVIIRLLKLSLGDKGSMDILIIGNGFDLAHGLKTSYKDFLNFCKNIGNADHEVNPCFKECCTKNLWMKHFITRQNELGDTWIDLEKEIYNVISSPNIKDSHSFPILFRVPHFNDHFIFGILFDHKIDIRYTPEVGDKEYTTSVYSDPGCNFYAYIKTYNGFINFLYDQLREFTKVFEIYLVEIIQRKSDSESYIFSLKEGVIPQNVRSVQGLSFNYTDTCERLYNPTSNWYSKYNIKPIYVHGKAGSNKACNMVFGTHSFKNKDAQYISFNIPVEFNVFKKYHQRHRYGTIEAYQQLLREIKDYNREIIFHIVGHSLDETDHIILEHILNINKNSIIKIYYHDEESHVRLINNIEKIIGEKEVMARVQFIYQHDPQRGILRKLNGTA